MEELGDGTRGCSLLRNDCDVMIMIKALQGFVKAGKKEEISVCPQTTGRF